MKIKFTWFRAVHPDGYEVWNEATFDLPAMPAVGEKVKFAAAIYKVTDTTWTPGREAKGDGLVVLEKE